MMKILIAAFLFSSIWSIGFAQYQDKNIDSLKQELTFAKQDIGRVLLNLINNAFYAVAERSRSTVAERSRSTVQQRASVGVTRSHADTTYQSTVTVSTQKTGDQIIIKVKDNGNGIPEAIKAKIFQPFFTTKPTGQGTGWGLSLAYNVVTKGYGGSIEVNSVPNAGTGFIIRLV